MPYVTPKEDIVIKQGRATLTLKGGNSVLLTANQLAAYEHTLKLQEAELAQETFGDVNDAVTLVDDDPEVAAVMAEMNVQPVTTSDETDREALIDDVIFELRSSGDTSVLTKSTGEVKISEIKKRLGFTISDEERDASEERLKAQGLV